MSLVPVLRGISEVLLRGVVALEEMATALYVIERDLRAIHNRNEASGSLTYLDPPDRLAGRE